MVGVAFSGTPGTLGDSTVPPRPSSSEDSTKPPARTRHGCLVNVLGLNPDRTCCGSYPLDIGVRSKEACEPWFVDNEEEGLSDHASFFNTPLYSIPRVRHLWGDAQQKVHPGGQELFLDLIFVGAAYQVSGVLKPAFYDCVQPGYNATGSSYVHAKDECVGLGLGILHACAPFMSMYLLWVIETRFRAQFLVVSKFHYMLDALGNLLLIFAAMNMQHVQAYREIRGEPGLGRVLVPILIALGVWIVRLLELALLATRENARRQATTEVITNVQIFGLWAAAYILSLADFGDAASNALASDGACGLMMLGNMWWIVKQAYHCVIGITLHHKQELYIERTIVCSNMGFIFHRNNEFMFLMLGETILQIVIGAFDEKSALYEDEDGFFNTKALTATAGFVVAVCMMLSFRAMVEGQLSTYEKTNQGLTAEATETDTLLNQVRKNKNAALARNESLTSNLAPSAAIVGRSSFRGTSRDGTCAAAPASNVPAPAALAAAAAAPTEEPPKEPRTSTGGGRATRVMSAISQNAGALKKFIDTRSLDKDFATRQQGIVIHMRLYNVVNTLLWQVKALAIMLVGVGVKLAIYSPRASPVAHYAAPQRLEVSLSLTLVFLIQILHLVFIKTRHHYSLAALAAHPLHVVILASRLVALVASAALSAARLEPLVFLWLQAAFASLQCALSHAQDSRGAIHSANSHPMTALPGALHALHQRRAKQRDERPYDEGLDSNPSSFNKQERNSHVASADDGADHASDGSRDDELFKGPMAV